MKKFIVRLLLIAAGLLPAAIPTVAYAIDLNRVDNDAAIEALNRGSMNVFGRYRIGTQLLTNQKRAVRCTYDFAVLGGGTAAALTLRASTTLSGDSTSQPCILPKGAVVTAAYLDTITAFAATANTYVQLGTGQSASDLLANTIYSDSHFSGAGIKALVPVGTAATSIKMTADANPIITLKDWPMTAGKVYVLIEYLLSQTL